MLTERFKKLNEFAAAGMYERKSVVYFIEKH